MTYDQTQLSRDLWTIMTTIGQRKQVGFFTLPSFVDGPYEISMYDHANYSPTEIPIVYASRDKVDLATLDTESPVGQWILAKVIYAEELAGASNLSAAGRQTVHSVLNT